MKPHLLLLCFVGLTIHPICSQNDKFINPASNRALFFAVDTYEYLPNLGNPVSNAEELAAILEKDYNFDTKVIRNPSKDQIETVLEQYTQEYAQKAPDDPMRAGQLLIYFSGHGEREVEGGYFIPSDGDPKDLRNTGLYYGIWQYVIDDIPCQHILVIIDACYSVMFDPHWNSRSGFTFSRPGEEGDLGTLLQNHGENTTRFFFTSDANEEQTPDNSDFAKKLLEGLIKPSRLSEVMTSTELFAQLEFSNPKPHGGTFGSDQAGSSFLFFRNEPGLRDKPMQELDAWSYADSISSIQSYREYIERFPGGEFREYAEEQVQIMERKREKELEISAWEKAKIIGTEAAFKAYIRSYPEGEFKVLAEREIRKLKFRERSSALKEISTQEFLMGAQSREANRDEGPMRHIELNEFLMSAYEISFEEFDEFCLATNRQLLPDQGWGRGKQPVINVSWYDAILYCNWRSEKEGLVPVYAIDKRFPDPNNHSLKDKQKWNIACNWEANGYRLPTEAEWEYAAREGGKSVRFGNGKDIADPQEMNFNAQPNLKRSYSKVGPSSGKPLPIASTEANALGLYDMAGNVWEWCWDWYNKGYYQERKSIHNPLGPESGESRVVRGGSWSDDPKYCRTTNRLKYDPTTRNEYIGFRVVRRKPD